MKLTLDFVAKDPDKFKTILKTKDGEQLIFRPLGNSDLDALTLFINNLSDETKRFYSYTEPSSEIAAEICHTINKYDKLRFVLENSRKQIVGMFELSFDIPTDDKERFKNYNISLSSQLDCRFGPVLLDNYQGMGVGSLVLPLIVDIARRFGQKRLILWGGVHADNPQALNYYKKNNFKSLDRFKNRDGLNCYDMLLELDNSS